MLGIKPIVIAAVLATSLVAPQAKAYWYNANINCITVEEMSSGGPGLMTPHTPDELIWWMNGGPSTGHHFVDVTAQFPFLNPNVARALELFPEQTFNVWTNNIGACRELQQRITDMERFTPHPSPFK
jgi:hypothetical protein